MCTYAQVVVKLVRFRKLIRPVIMDVESRCIFIAHSESSGYSSCAARAALFVLLCSKCIRTLIRDQIRAGLRNIELSFSTFWDLRSSDFFRSPSPRCRSFQLCTLLSLHVTMHFADSEVLMPSVQLVHNK